MALYTMVRNFCSLVLSSCILNVLRSDLLGVPDRNVWAYGEALRSMSAAKELNNIKFNRLRDLVHVDVPDEMDEITYVTNATNFRLALLNSFSKRDYDVDLKIADHEDTCLTYRGYLKFLETDLQTMYPINEERSKKKYKKGLGYIAKQMLFRGDVSPPRLAIPPSRQRADIDLGFCTRSERDLLRPHSTINPPLDW